MFWIVILFVMLGFVFVKLGALSVWVHVFSIALGIAGVVIAGLCMLVVLRWAIGRWRHRTAVDPADGARQLIARSASAPADTSARP